MRRVQQKPSTIVKDKNTKLAPPKNKGVASSYRRLAPEMAIQAWSTDRCEERDPT